MSARTPSKIVSSRASSGSRADARPHPPAPARRAPPRRAPPARSPAGIRTPPPGGGRRFLGRSRTRAQPSLGRCRGPSRMEVTQEPGRSFSDAVPAPRHELLGAVFGRPGVQALARRLNLLTAHRLRSFLQLLDLLGGRN